MIEFIQNYLWWVVWIITIPFVVFCVLIYYFMVVLDKLEEDIGDL